MTAERVDALLDAMVEEDPEELYEAAPCGYLSTTPDGTIIKVNETLLAWTGYARGDMEGTRRFQDILAPGDRIFYETHFSPLLRMQGRVREIAAEIVCEGGRRLPVLINSLLKEGPDGEPLVVRTAIFDATERRSYERELVAARRRAEESDARATALAKTLQASFIPPAILEVPGFEIGGAYRPSGDGSEVGGDFYDVFETGRGTWAVVIGDVMGKGAGAAVITSLARYTVRAEALRTPHPHRVLEGLHHAMVRFHPDRFLTAVFMSIDQTDEGPLAVVAAGGHHLPLRVRDGVVEPIGEHGTIVGMVDEPRISDTAVQLEPGDTVVVVTDGVLEARHLGEPYGEERLEQLLAESGTLEAQAIADRVVDDVLAFQHNRALDDIAVVVVKVPLEA